MLKRTIDYYKFAFSYNNFKNIADDSVKYFVVFV